LIILLNLNKHVKSEIFQLDLLFDSSFKLNCIKVDLI